MANLMITKQCNLHCSYCFANEFVNKQKDIMSFENFMKCMKFLSYNPKAVSYTHLDVYKRQIMKCVMISLAGTSRFVATA